MADKGRHAQKSHKGLVVTIIIIILLAGLGAGGYYFRDQVLEVYHIVIGTSSTSNSVKLSEPTVSVSKSTTTVPTTVATDPVTKKAEQLMSKMGQNEKICQLFVVTPEQLTGVDVATVAGDTTKSQLIKYPVGGIVYFKKNNVDDKSFKEMIKKTKSYAKTPLFIMENGDDELFTYSNELKVSDKLTDDSNGKKAVEAFKGGAKVLIMPKNLEKCVGGFAKAVKNGEIDSTAVDSAVVEILKVKINKGIIK
ncbi:MAG: hypothetical protein IJV39_02270 [Ruminococcus sp.]|nr:hypothetical protein [Ruminococcus sp.]